MRLPIRTLAFAAATAGLWAADVRYRDAVLAPEAAAAAVAQATSDGSAALADVHRRGNWADADAVGGTALAAVACLATWRPRPRITYHDRRTRE